MKRQGRHLPALSFLPGAGSVQGDGLRHILRATKNRPDGRFFMTAETSQATCTGMALALWLTVLSALQ